MALKSVNLREICNQSRLENDRNCRNIDRLQKQVVRLYPVDLNLDSLLTRACQHLKPYLLSATLDADRDRCAAHLGASWNRDQPLTMIR